MPIDVHVHAKGIEDGNRVLRAMDRAGLERIVLMCAPPHFPFESETPATIGYRTVIDALARTVAADPQRLIGFAWIEPTLSDAEEMVDYALGEKELSGVKMIPYHWYPDDERAQAVYRKVSSHAKPMLFHSGIPWMGTNTSKYCRPAEFEIMM